MTLKEKLKSKTLSHAISATKGAVNQTLVLVDRAKPNLGGKEINGGPGTNFFENSTVRNRYIFNSK